MALFGFGRAFIGLLLIFVVVLPIAAIIDIAKREFKENGKLIWMLIVLFLNPIGAVLYVAKGKNKKNIHDLNTN
jgi:hypothetical protein|tara:strand:- start:1025 stop:1246 length:222 start_codon:yes stop_codon:yes gene_type:complete